MQMLHLVIRLAGSAKNPPSRGAFDSGGIGEQRSSHVSKLPSSARRPHLRIASRTLALLAVTSVACSGEDGTSGKGDGGASGAGATAGVGGNPTGGASG